ncbi:hypothetical protein [Actinocrispum wychmicini]|uniref:Uncharacterized protein n=1 Tax=Actinocrispum wychmicini TaxID=1213861 RepID=A0A4R2JQ93_9PSEU|nr:hypothetical protein [Actinocrispum wychmicini]TCO62383.1 hypothetical protein EV192_102521 [Actinocrispum wychmicini]
MPTDDRLTAAVVAYLPGGWRRDPVAAGDALVEVTALADEVTALPVDWTVHDLASAVAMARDEMRRRHPELGPAAIAVLGTYFAYQWK